MEERLFTDYDSNIKMMREILRVKESFDVIERHLTVAERDMCFYYVDGFVKDGEMLRIMQYVLSLKEISTAVTTSSALRAATSARPVSWAQAQADTPRAMP